LLDDLHWADSASLDLLLHLARQTRASRVLLLGIHRDVELPPHEPLPAALRELHHEHLLERIAVERLGLTGTAALMAACLGRNEVTEEFAAHVHEPTEGNAFFVQEVLRTLIERGDLFRQDEQWQRRAVEEIAVPETVRAAIGERVSRLAPATQTLLREASVLGQAFSFDDLWRMEERDEAEVEAGLAEAMAAGLVRERGDEACRFSHALTRQALAAYLTPRQTRRLHLAAGAAIERQPERARSRRAAELARHFLAGDASERALPYALLAGDQAEALYAHTEAEHHYRTALEVAHALGDRAREAEAAEKLANNLEALARNDGAMEVGLQALAVYRELEDVEGQRRMSAWLAQRYIWRLEPGGPAAGWALLTPLLEAARDAAPSRGGLELLSAASQLFSTGGQPAEAVEAAERMLAVAHELGDRYLLAQAHWRLAEMLMAMGRDDDALSALRVALEWLEDIGDLESLVVVLTWIADIQLRHGNLAKCEGDLVRARDLAARIGRPGTVIHTLICLGQWSFWVGNWPRARCCLEQADAIWQRSEYDDNWKRYWHAHVSAQLGPLALATDHMDGVVTLEEAVALATALPGAGPTRAEGLQIGNAALAEREILRGE
ncbi:MAG TPA: hypothetical protein VID72_06975, partial [Ktedonobacterales bacterium]